MERHLDEELKTLKNNLVKMAALSEEAIHKAIEALKKQDKELAQLVINDDKEIDDLENVIEEEAIEILALYQPMAKDLRFITTGMHVNSELESIADLAVNISQRALEISSQPLLKPLIDIPKLAETTKQMVRGAIDSFINEDQALAEKIIVQDKEANELRTKIMRELVQDYMIKDGSTAPRAVPLLLVARDLERMCDHAVTIAEDVIYMINAKLVKHHLEEFISVYKKKENKS